VSTETDKEIAERVRRSCGYVSSHKYKPSISDIVALCDRLLARCEADAVPEGSDDLLELCNDFLSVIPKEPIGHDIHRVCRALKNRIEADALLNKTVGEIEVYSSYAGLVDSEGERCAFDGRVVSYADHLAAMRSRAEGVADGWKLVPVEPTKEMFKAAHDIDISCHAGNYGYGGADPGQIYEAMLSAAPTPTGGTKDE
jgi:hypothetical protein